VKGETHFLMLCYIGNVVVSGLRQPASQSVNVPLISEIYIQNHLWAMLTMDKFSQCLDTAAAARTLQNTLLISERSNKPLANKICVLISSRSTRLENSSADDRDCKNSRSTCKLVVLSKLGVGGRWVLAYFLAGGASINIQFPRRELTLTGVIML